MQKTPYGPMAQALGKWFEQNKRDLPWRKTKDSYKILVSEIMLQQTVVKAVIPFYERFLVRFPTAQALANATEEEVLSHWSGLGYYSRARNLQRAAQALTTREIENNFSAWLNLPGVGPYTAAAVASIAFGEKKAAVDGNVIRVVTRLFDIKGSIQNKATLAEIQIHAQKLMDQASSASVQNQAMMELGATICIPQKPACLLCPLQKNCLSFKRGTTALRPVRPPRRKPETWGWELFIVTKKSKVALVRGKNGSPWLQSMWVLPGKAAPLKNKPSKGEFDFTHAITHHKIFVKLKKAPAAKIPPGCEVAWVDQEEIHGKGFSSIVKKALTVLKP